MTATDPPDSPNTLAPGAAEHPSEAQEPTGPSAANAAAPSAPEGADAPPGPRRASGSQHGPEPELPLAALGSREPTTRLLRYIALEGGLLRIIVVYSIAIGLLSLAVPLAVQVLINTISFRTLLQPVVVLSALLLLALFASTALHALETIAVEHVGRRFMLRVVGDLSARFPRIAATPTFIRAHRFFEVGIVDKALTSLLFEGIAAGLQVATATILLALYHPYLLGFAALFTVTSWFAIVPLGRGAIRSSMAESSAKYALGDFFDKLERDRDRSPGGSAARIKAEDLASRWIDARSSHFSTVFRQQVTLFAIGALFNALLLFVGGRLVIEGQLSLGQLVAAELVTTVAVRSLAKVGQLLPKYYDLVTALEKIGAIIDLPLEESNPDSHGGASAGGGASIPSRESESASVEALTLSAGSS